MSSPCLVLKGWCIGRLVTTTNSVEHNLAIILIIDGPKNSEEEIIARLPIKIEELRKRIAYLDTEAQVTK